MRAKKYLNKIGVEREDYDYLKQIGKALLCSYTILGALWFYNGGTSPLEWLKQKTRLKEEIELAHFYPSDGESMKEFIDKMGRMIGTTSGTKGMVESDKAASKCPEELPSKKVDQDAQKLWLKMRNEVISELREKGYDVE